MRRLYVGHADAVWKNRESKQPERTGIRVWRMVFGVFG